MADNVAHWSQIMLSGDQEEQMLFTFNCKSVNSITNLTVNKDFSQAIFQDRETKFSVFVLDLKRQRIQNYYNLGAEFKLRSNSFLYLDFVGVVKEQDRQKQILNASQDLFTKSMVVDNNCSFDICQNLSNGADSCLAEVTSSASDSDLLQVWLHSGTSVQTCEIKEFQNMQVCYPFVVFNKGNHRLVIKNLHEPRQKISIELETQENFMCFIDVSDESLQPSELLTEEDIFCPDGDEEHPEEHSMQFNYVSSCKQGFVINNIKLFPF